MRLSAQPGSPYFDAALSPLLATQVQLNGAPVHHVREASEEESWVDVVVQDDTARAPVTRLTGRVRILIPTAP